MKTFAFKVTLFLLTINGIYRIGRKLLNAISVSEFLIEKLYVMRLGNWLGPASLQTEILEEKLFIWPTDEIET